MRKRYILLTMFVMGLTATGCQSRRTETNEEATITTIESQASETMKESKVEGTKIIENSSTQKEIGNNETVKSREGYGILVAYFTYGENTELPDDVDASSSASIQLWNGEVTGNMGLLAHMTAEASGADLFSIRTSTHYPSTYDETLDQGQEENRAASRPERSLSMKINKNEKYNKIIKNVEVDSAGIA